jgi:hypothetical protein
VSVTIDDLVGLPADREVCNGVFMRLATAAQALGAGVSHESEAVVVLTWEAHGLIGNGGFECLYESPMLEEDPGFARTIAAFDSLGLHEVSGAFRETLQWFPSPGPPSSPWKRSDLVHARPKKERNSAYDRTYSERKLLPQKLAAYIRAHKAELETILSDYEQRRWGLSKVDLSAAVTWDLGERPMQDAVPELLIKLNGLPQGGILLVVARHPGVKLDAGDPNAAADITTEQILRQFCGNAGHVVLRVEPPRYWIRGR